MGNNGEPQLGGATSTLPAPPAVEAPTASPTTPASPEVPPHQAGPSAAPVAAVPQNKPEPAPVASVPVLPAAPADDAPLGDWEDYLLSLKERRQSLLDEGYPENGEQVKAVAAAIAVADERIAAMTASIEEIERNARVAKAHKDAERASNRSRIAEIKRNVGRKVASAAKYAGVDDKLFVGRRKTIADSTNQLERISDPDEIETVKRLRIDIDDAVDWILRNGPAREGIVSQEEELKALGPELERVGAARLAAQSFNAARRQERESASLRDKADYEGAAGGYRQAKALYEKAIAEAKTAQAEACVVRAECLKTSGLWEDCLKAADEALEWDAGNAKAQTLKQEAQNAIDAERKAKEEAERKKREAEEAARRDLEAKAAAEKAERERQERERQESERRKRETEEAARTPRAGDLKAVAVGSQTIRLHWCPAGSFMMGSPSTEKDCGSDETPQHLVTLTQGFWMGETEVTQGLWEEVLGNNPANFKSGDDYPVERVSWEDCQEFMKKLNARFPKSGLRWALPTEAQWEYACRAGTTGSYSGSGRLDDIGWYDGNSGSKTHPVKQKPPNAWGLLLLCT